MDLFAPYIRRKENRGAACGSVPRVPFYCSAFGAAWSEDSGGGPRLLLSIAKPAARPISYAGYEKGCGEAQPSLGGKRKSTSLWRL